MKMSEALRIINSEKPKGYMVSFEVKEGSICRGDYFPDKHAGEPLIETEQEAWDIARKFASKTDINIVNIYVVHHDFRPVDGYGWNKLKPIR